MTELSRHLKFFIFKLKVDTGAMLGLWIGLYLHVCIQLHMAGGRFGVGEGSISFLRLSV